MSILELLKNKQKQIAVLIDPDKHSSEVKLMELIKKINLLSPAYIFIGGSTVNANDFQSCFSILKQNTKIPLVIFPGSHIQIDEKADAILFLSLISGRNPDFLIGHQVQAAHKLKQMKIEVIPTAYILIDGGKNSSVAYISQTSPIPADQINIAVNTAIAGELMGMQTVFLDAGSGAINSVSLSMIKEVAKNISVPLIIGGGLKTIQDIENTLIAGANVAVIGNKIEENIDFLLDLMNLTFNKK
jgi:putative glycerol-1-phosphate prenyltransferase